MYVLLTLLALYLSTIYLSMYLFLAINLPPTSPYMYVCTHLKDASDVKLLRASGSEQEKLNMTNYTWRTK